MNLRFIERNGQRILQQEKRGDGGMRTWWEDVPTADGVKSPPAETGVEKPHKNIEEIQLRELKLKDAEIASRRKQVEYRDREIEELRRKLRDAYPQNTVQVRNPDAGEVDRLEQIVADKGHEIGRLRGLLDAHGNEIARLRTMADSYVGEIERLRALRAELRSKLRNIFALVKDAQ